jgi:ribosomal protein S18 acetylase RimI-like enzyme
MNPPSSTPSPDAGDLQRATGAAGRASPFKPSATADDITCPRDFDVANVTVRLACAGDHPYLCELFRESILEGLVGDNDTGADIDNLQEGYFSDEGASGFWVAEHGKVVIGMIGVQKTADNAAEVRRLRVRGSYRRRGVGALLMQQAMAFCRQHGYLKVVLDVRIERGPAISLFEKFGFSHTRTRDIDGRKLLDFYLDLYREPKR